MDTSPQLLSERHAISTTEFQCGLSPRILLVDGDRQVLSNCLAALLRRDYKVDALDDGETAWEILLSKNYDLLITSHDLPRLSGVALIRQLRLAEMNLPIILTAAGVISESVSRNPWHQIAAVLSRPFNDDQLLSLVDAILVEADHHVRKCTGRAE